MKKNIWKLYKKLPIKDLCLWDENARFPEEYFKKTEKDLIEYFLKDEKKYEIQKFAREIVNELDLPQFEELLVLEIKGKNIVLEGNRRLTVYKLLNDPTLTDIASVRKFFEELKKKIVIDSNFSLVVHTTTNKEEGLRFIDRKHNKGNNEVGWGEIERSHFAVRRNKGFNKDVFKVEIAKKVKALNIPEIIKSEVLGKGYVTTLFRILDNPAAREKLQYSVAEDGHLKIDNIRIFLNFLKTIVYNVWTKKGFNPSRYIDSRTLNSSDEIKEYLDELSADDFVKVDQGIKTSESKDIFGKSILTRPIFKKPNKEVVDLLSKEKMISLEEDKELQIFVIMPFAGLDEVYKAIKKSAIKNLHKVNVYTINHSFGAKISQDQKIEAAIESSDLLVVVLSMGDKEKLAFNAIKKDKNAKDILSKFYPINHNVLVELGYGLKSVKSKYKKDIFIIVDSNRYDDLPNLKEFTSNGFFDIRNRGQMFYKNMEELKKELDKAFKGTKSLKNYLKK